MQLGCQPRRKASKKNFQQIRGVDFRTSAAAPGQSYNFVGFEGLSYKSVTSLGPEGAGGVAGRRGHPGRF